MKYYIINSGFNWADEIDFEGILVIDENQKERITKALKIYQKEDGNDYTVCCGSNETVDTTVDDLLDEVESAYEVSEKDLRILLRLLGTENYLDDYEDENYIFSFGSIMVTDFIEGYDLDEILESVEDEEEADSEDDTKKAEYKFKKETVDNSYDEMALFYRKQFVLGAEPDNFKEIVTEMYDWCLGGEAEDAYDAIDQELDGFYDDPIESRIKDRLLHIYEEDDDNELNRNFPALIDFEFDEDSMSFKCGDWEYIIYEANDEDDD